MQCGQCVYWVPITEEQREQARSQGAMLPDGIGHCHGMPPTVHLIPVPAPRNILRPDAGQQVGMAPANFRPIMLREEIGCGMGEIGATAANGGVVN